MGASVAGLRVLLVEDETLVAMLLEDALEELGCTVVGPISRVDAAEATIDRELFDCALLDINLHGKAVYPLAELLAKRSVPFGFVTGYESAGVAAPFGERPILQKPFGIRELAAVLARLTRGKQGSDKRPRPER